MVTLQATRVPIDVNALAEAARGGPVTVMHGDTAAFVVLDPAEYHRLTAADTDRRREAGRRAMSILAVIDDIVASRATDAEIAALEREAIDED